MVYYPFILTQFVLSFFADADPRLSDYAPVEVNIIYVYIYIYLIPFWT